MENFESNVATIPEFYKMARKSILFYERDNPQNFILRATRLIAFHILW